MVAETRQPIREAIPAWADVRPRRAAPAARPGLVTQPPMADMGRSGWTNPGSPMP